MPTNQEINRALAGLMNYVPLSTAWDPYNECYGYIPRWSSDPAASLEVQAKACDVDYESYILHLMDAVYGGYVAASSERIAGLLTASPRDRAMAAYLTIMGAQEWTTK